MNTTYKLKVNSIIFHPIFDKLNEYSTYVYDNQTDVLLKINNTAYVVLYKIKTDPNVTFEQITNYTNNVLNENHKKVSDTEISSIIEHFIKKQIIQKT